MAALSAARATTQLGGAGPLPEEVSYPVKADAICYAGGIAVIDTGYAKPGAAATGLVAVGIFQKTVDNTGGADGAVTVPVRAGVFVLENATSTDACSQAEAGTDIYILNDQTVTKTDTGHSKVGKMVNMVSTKVAVLIGLGVV